MIIPIDRKYNEQNMQEGLPILAGIEHFVFYGSLLGLIREGDLLEKDDDIDLLINMKHFDEVLERFDKHRGALEIKQEGNNLEECRYFRQATCIRDGGNTYVDFYFYDGEHSYQNQFDNLQIVDQFLDSNSIILIDDYNFSDVENATKNFVDKTKNNYSIIKEIKTFNNHWHPTYWNGIAILKKK